MDPNKLFLNSVQNTFPHPKNLSMNRSKSNNWPKPKFNFSGRSSILVAEGITEVQSNILIKSISRYSQKNRSKDYKLNSTTSHTIANKHFFVLQGTIYYDNLI